MTRAAGLALLCSSPMWGAQGFDKIVAPVLAENCMACHSNRGAAGGLDMAYFLKESSIRGAPDEWEAIIKKLRSGQMPPKGSPRPSQARIDALIEYVESPR